MKNRIIGALIFIFYVSAVFSAQLGMGNGRIKGIIQDEAGNPLAGAQVEMVNLTYKNLLTTKSDKKGRWSISGIAGGRYGITVKLEGYADAKIEMPISLVAKLSVTLDVTLKKHDPNAEITTHDPKSAGLAKLLQEGNRLYDEQKFGEAAAKFAAFLADNPGTYQVNINLGNCYLQTKDYDKAIAAYGAYLDKVRAEKGSFKGDETAAKILSAIGRAYLEQRLMDNSIEYFKKAIEAFPNDELLAYNVGEVLFNQGRADEAIEYLQIAVKIKENWAPPHLKLGYAYLNRGKYRPALDSFKKFVELAPEDQQAQAVRSLIPKIEELAKKEDR